MSFSSETAWKQYTGNGTTVDFTVPFPFQADADLGVMVTTSGVDSTKVLNTDYVATGEGTTGGGNVRFTTAPASGTTVTLFRNMELNQTRSFTYNGSFPSRTVADAADKAMQAVQQLYEKVKRTFRISEANDEIAPLSVEDRAGKVIGFDEDGGPALYAPEITVFPYGAPYSVSTITALKAVAYTVVPTGTQVSVTQYTTAGDGGGGLFYVDKSDTTTADNGGTVIVATDGTRLKRIYGGSLSTAMFGCKTDGTTDDTTAFQAAVTAAAALQIPLVMPPGTSIATQLLIPSNCRLAGSGMGISIIKKKAGTGEHFVYLNAVNNVLLQGFTIDGDKTNTINTVFGFFANGCYNITIRDCESKNHRSHGFDIRNGVDGVNKTFSEVINCTSKSNSGTGINFDSQDHLYINECTLTDNTLNGAGDDGSGSTEVYIENSFISGNGQSGIATTFNGSIATPRTERLFIRGNTVLDNTYNGIGVQAHYVVCTDNICHSNGNDFVYQGIVVNAYNIICNNNITTENFGTGIDLGDAENIVCNGNISNLNGIFGIEVNSVLSATVTGNLCSGNQASTGQTVGSRAGIMLDTAGFAGDIVGCTVTGNVVEAGANQEFGLMVTTDAKKVVIANNSFLGAGSVQDVKIQTNEYYESNNIVTVNAFSPDLASATTVTIPDVGSFFNITGTTTITTISQYGGNVPQGRVVNLRFSGALLVDSGAGNLFLNADMTTSTGAVLTLIGSSGAWNEVSRSN